MIHSDQQAMRDAIAAAAMGCDPPPHDDASHIPAREWPDPLAPEAYHGVIGDLIRVIEPHTEADPAAVLIQTLVAIGNLIGRTAYYTVEATRHYMILFAVVVGLTSRGRKGTSLDHVIAALAGIDDDWSRHRRMSGLASGEGLIWRVRDPIVERQPIKEHGRVTGYEEVETDQGESDKRLLIVEPEFSRVLTVCERESCTLSAIIRDGWDRGNLDSLVKSKRARATGAHISIIGHITRDELQRLLTDTAAGNGFANRFLWVCARRSKLLPEGGSLDPGELSQITERIRRAVEFARGVGEMRRDDDARAMWHDVYPVLSDGRPGLHGAVTSRAEAITMRLACLYALLDRSAVIRPEHLGAALAVWSYCDASARYIFGDALGDGTADEILRALRARPEGMTRTEIREHFARNKSSAEIARALGVLVEYGLAAMTRERETDGQCRPSERWRARCV